MHSAPDGISQTGEDVNQVETQLQRRDHSSIQKSNYMKSGNVKVPPEELAKMKNDPNDIANMTSVTMN